MSLDATGLLAAVVSHAQAVGRLEQVNQHEPKSAPQGLLTGAVWVQEIRPLPAASGLASTTVLVTVVVRMYKNMLSEPQDAIDPDIMAALDALAAAYSGAFELGGQARNVDLLGEFGPGMWSRAGYINQDQRMFRVMDLMVPIVINDLWSQAA